MITKAGKIFMTFLCFMFVVAGGMGAEVFAAENEFIGDLNISSAGDDDPPADYMIDGKRVLRNFYNEEYDPYSDKTKTQGYLALGNNAGASHITSFNCSHLTDPDERKNCYQMDFSNFNIFIGDEAGRDFTRGRGNTYIGYQAAASGGFDNGTGWTARQNVVIGTYANAGGKLQAYNTVVGALAGYKNEGGFNTFIGTEAGGAVTTGTANILIGVAAGQGHYRGRGNYPIETGSNNIHLGTQTEVDSQDISHTIAFGDLTRVEASHQMVVGSDVFWICVDDPAVGMVKCGGSAICQADPGTTLLSCDYANIEESYWGSGIRAAWQDINPQDGKLDVRHFSINATGGDGTDMPGANLILAGGKSTGSADGGYLIFQTSLAGASGTNQNALQDRVIIAPNGNVGIGSAIPQAKLDVSGDIAASGPRGDGLTWDSTWGVLRIESYGCQDALVVSGGGSNVGFRTGGCEGVGTFTNNGFALYSNSIERVYITNTGEVGIGTNSPTYPLEMASGAHVTAGGVWTDASSREYKENISELTADKAMETLNGLNPVEFNYKVDRGEKYVGFIAEEVPELVATNDRKGLSPMDIVAVLTSVVKEQQKMMEKQQKTISTLSQKLNELEKEVKLKGSLAMVDSHLN